MTARWFDFCYVWTAALLFVSMTGCWMQQLQPSSVSLLPVVQVNRLYGLADIAGVHSGYLGLSVGRKNLQLPDLPAIK